MVGMTPKEKLEAYHAGTSLPGVAQRVGEIMQERGDKWRVVDDATDEPLTMTDSTTVRIQRAYIALARSIIPGGDQMPAQAVVGTLIRAGLDALQSTPTDALTCLQSAGRATILPCGLTLVAHWIDEHRRALVAIGHGGWTVPVELLPAVVEAVEACETVDEAIGAVYRVVGA